MHREACSFLCSRTAANSLSAANLRRYVHGFTTLYPPESQPEEPDIPLKDMFDFTLLREHSKKYLREKYDNVVNKVWFPIAEHDQTMVQWRFNKPESFDNWTVTSDSEFKRGFSKCELLRSKNNTAIFRGYLDTTVPRDGTTSYSGMVQLKSRRIYKAFFRPIRFMEWARFSHLLLKVRGDGRNYTVILHTPGVFDTNWHDYYAYPLYTHGGPYWQYAKIPFSKFIKGVHSRIQQNQEPVMKPVREHIDYYNSIVSIGISLFDGVDGPFNLELDWIGVNHNTMHCEEFAYESYEPPIRF